MLRDQYGKGCHNEEQTCISEPSPLAENHEQLYRRAGGKNRVGRGGSSADDAGARGGRVGYYWWWAALSPRRLSETDIVSASSFTDQNNAWTPSIEKIDYTDDNDDVNVVECRLLTPFPTPPPPFFLPRRDDRLLLAALLLLPVYRYPGYIHKSTSSLRAE